MSGDEAEQAPASLAGSAAREAAFLGALGRCIEDRRSSGRNLPVLLIESGIIGRIDAVWGYGVGDAVRSRIAASLRAELLREEDPIGEMGRGKFGCALTAVDDPSVALLAAEKALRILNGPLMIGEDEIYARPAIGVAMWPAHGDDPGTVLHRARAACMIARDLAGRVAMYAEDQENPEASRFLYENRLRGAVAEDTIEMVFQPQYDLRLGQIMGAESLLRWRDPRQGLIPVRDAFTVAESAGTVNELVSSMLNRALRNCSEFRYSAGLDLRIGVNLPGRTLLHVEIADIVERALRTWNLRPGRLVAEIGDIAVLESDPVARETLGRLKELGVRLSIDDENMTVSSLFWLATMPFREIKIDVTSATDLAVGAHSGRIMHSLVELGHQLKLDVVAVGAADDAVEACLKELGCDYVQSDKKAPPLEAQEFVTRYGLS